MKTVIIFFSIILINSCSTVNKKITDNKNETKDIILDFKDGPPTIIYKTKNNYNELVPVILSKDKGKIISYPHPADLKRNEKFLYPTVLENGYLLDNKGINQNVAFLKVTYKEYSLMDTIPSLENLYSMIIDKDPLQEIYNCGNKYAFKDLISNLNTLIKNDDLKKCKKIDIK